MQICCERPGEDVYRSTLSDSRKLFPTFLRRWDRIHLHLRLLRVTLSLLGAARYGLWRPFLAPLTCNIRVTSAEHFQDTRHLEFDLTGSGMRYAPGDLLTIFPQQSPSALSAFYKSTNLNPDAWVKVEAADVASSGYCAPVQVSHAHNTNMLLKTSCMKRVFGKPRAAHDEGGRMITRRSANCYTACMLPMPSYA